MTLTFVCIGWIKKIQMLATKNYLVHKNAFIRRERNLTTASLFPLVPIFYSFSFDSLFLYFFMILFYFLGFFLIYIYNRFCFLLRLAYMGVHSSSHNSCGFYYYLYLFLLKVYKNRQLVPNVLYISLINSNLF